MRGKFKEGSGWGSRSSKSLTFVCKVVRTINVRITTGSECFKNISSLQTCLCWVGNWWMVLIQKQVVLVNFRFPGREPVIDTFKKRGGTYHNWGSTRPGAGHLVEADHWGLHHWWSLLLHLYHQAFLVSTGHSPKKYLFWALHLISGSDKTVRFSDPIHLHLCPSAPSRDR